MKNKLFAFVLTVMLLSVVLFGGCACDGGDSLSFQNVLTAGETLTYKVTHVRDFNEKMKYDGTLDQIFTIAYGEGSLTYTLVRATDLADRTIGDITEHPLVKNKTIYKLTGEFNIPVTITVNGNKSERIETVTTVAYITESGTSFAPVYCTEQADYILLNAASSDPVIYVKSSSETVYNQDDYVKTQTVTYKTENGGDPVEKTETQVKNLSYDFRSAVDNAELLFVLRAMRIQEKGSANLPVISPTYDKAVTLQVTNNSNAEGRFDIVYNDADLSNEKIKYNELSFSINSSNTSGAEQYVYIQTEKSENVAQHSLLLKYIKPLTTYGTYKSMGALVFQLVKAEYSAN